MAITDLLSKVGVPGTVTSLAAPGKAFGATSINITSATNWETSTAVYFAIRVVDPATVSLANPSGLVANTFTEWKGQLAGNVISGLQLKSGTDQVYAAGVNTQVFIHVSPARENSLVDWGLAHANQDGTLKANIVTTTAINIAAVTAEKLATGAITLGYAEITTGVTKTTTAEESVAGLSLTVSVPVGGRRIKITFSGGYLSTGGTSNAGVFYLKEGTTYLADRRLQMPASETVVLPPVISIETPTAGVHTYNLTWALDNTQSITLNAGTKSITAGAKPIFILVEAI